MIFSQTFTSVYTPIWYITLILWIISELYLVFRDRNTTKQQDRGSRRYIGIAIIAGIAFSFLVGYNPIFWFQISPDTIMGISIGIMWAGIIIRFLAIRTLGRHFRTIIHIRDDHTIVKTGLYRYIRHPAYLGLSSVHSSSPWFFILSHSYHCCGNTHARSNVQDIT